jgi:hypothetical protein
VPGLRGISRQYELLETCALQWKICVETVREDWGEIPPARCMEVHYETLVNEPRPVLDRILSFAELEMSPSVERRVEGVSNDRVSVWRAQMSPRQRETVESLIGDMLEALGYG